MEKETLRKILKETEFGYDSISEKFSQTRKHFWRGLEFIKDYMSENSKVLDFGCGNGRLHEFLSDKQPQYYGVDVSEKLIEIAREKHEQEKATFSKINPLKSGEAGLPLAKFIRVNPIQTALPFDDNFFKTIYSIAVFHHFPSKKYRQDIANDLFRITENGGHIIITVWYLWQKKYLNNIIKNWKNKILGKSELDWNDCVISFTDNKGQVFQRFHHAYTKRELKSIFKKAGFEIERCDIPDGRNILLIGKKN